MYCMQLLLHPELFTLDLLRDVDIRSVPCASSITLDTSDRRYGSRQVKHASSAHGTGTSDLYGSQWPIKRPCDVETSTEDSLCHSYQCCN